MNHFIADLRLILISIWPNYIDNSSSFILDIAWDLLQRYPNLATTQDFYEDFPINILAGIRSAFLSGTPLRFWQRWIYESKY